MDTGASCNLLSESAYLFLKEFHIFLQRSDTVLHSVQGSKLHILGTVTYPLSLALNSKMLPTTFFVTSDFALPCDGLVGLHSLASHNNDIFPQRIAISSDGTLYTAMDSPAARFFFPK